jgi:hypothetical protein
MASALEAPESRTTPARIRATASSTNRRTLRVYHREAACARNWNDAKWHVGMILHGVRRAPTLVAWITPNGPRGW